MRVSCVLRRCANKVHGWEEWIFNLAICFFFHLQAVPSACKLHGIGSSSCRGYETRLQGWSFLGWMYPWLTLMEPGVDRGVAGSSIPLFLYTSALVSSQARDLVGAWWPEQDSFLVWSHS